MKEGEFSPMGYILRISRDEWVKQVFDLKKYYVGVRRRWEPGLTIFFARKAEKGDSFLGFGLIENVQGLEELSEEERSECEKWGWKHALNFKNVLKFEPPLPIKETLIKEVGLRGSRLHGYRLTSEQVRSILSKAEKMCNFV
ncbi:hypothetical protein IBX38_01085 [Candidatus Bathyarchaeota archaeon]|nr:hypothetical protein [Candidatus Bathyarchaeota archaeon]